MSVTAAPHTGASSARQHTAPEKISGRHEARACRVLHVVPSLHPGGMERAMLRLVGRMKTLAASETDPQEHAFAVLQDSDEELIDAARAWGPVHRLSEAVSGRRVPHSRWLYRRVLDVVEAESPDVVHARTTAVWMDAALAVRRLRPSQRPRLLLSFHGQTSAISPSIWRRMRDTPKRWAARQADAVLAVSAHIADTLESDWQVPGDRIQIIPNGVDVQVFRPAASSRERNRLREQLGIPLGARAVLCVANLVPVKNHSLLIRAFREVADRDPNMHLYLLGQGGCEQALRYLARDPRPSGRHQRIHFMGNRRDVPEWYRAVDLFALPSLYEGCSNATLEAMASGLPVLVSDVAGHRELVMDDHQGLLLSVTDAREWASAMTQCLEDPGYAARLGDQARREALRSYTLDRAAREYARLYAELAGHPTREGDRSCAE